jgi:hypothetical protein
MNITYELIKSEIDTYPKTLFNRLGAVDYGKKFSLIVLKQLSGIRSGKLDNYYTEGSGDHQIDGVYFDEEGDELVVNILTCKFSSTNSTIEDKDVTDFLQIGLPYVLFGEEKATDLNDRLKNVKDEYEELRESFENKCAISLKFVSTSDFVLSTNSRNAVLKMISDLQQNGINIDFEEINSKRLSAIFSSRTVKNTPIPIKLSGKSYYTLTGREGFICRLPVTEIIKMYNGFESGGISYPPYGDFLFVDNVRKNLGLEKKINQQIYYSATDSALASDFEHFNNGLTIIYSEKSGSLAGDSPIVFLKGMRVVNGCQTVSTLIKAYEDKNLCDELIYVNCRFLKETDEKSFIQSVITYTNSQNAITDRDLHSNDQIQYDIEGILENLGYFYERKLNEHRDKDDELRLDSLEGAQSYMCCELMKPSSAKQNKRRLFGDLYKEIFKSDNRELPYKLLISYKTLEYALIKQSENRIKKNKTKKLGKSPRFTMNDLVISHGSYHIATVLYSRFFYGKSIDELSKFAKKNTNFALKLGKEYHSMVKQISDLLKAEKIERDKVAAFFKQNEADKFLLKQTA